MKLIKFVISEKNINKFKIILANEATKILHGKEASAKSRKNSKKNIFEKKV